VSDVLRQYRVFPRLFAIFYLAMTWDVVTWAMTVPDMSNAQAAFVSAITAGAAAYFKFYVETSGQ